jgi:polyribonucleotide nucleotidyltransferase
LCLPLSLNRKVAGIAMGLILGSEASGGGDKLDPIVLTDILGSEDALGDMDFKVAGDKDGITAFQMDIKVEGITIDVMRTALQEAQTGLVHILGEMEKCNPAPAGAMSKYAPQVGSIPVAEKYFGKVIGKGGETIRSIIEQTKVDSIDVDKDTQIVTVTGGAGSDVGAALEYIKNLIAEPEIGKIYRDCVVKKVVEFGAFVEYMPGQEGLCHISELDVARVPNASDVVTEGQTIDVKLVEVNSRGQTRLSRKEVLLEENPELAAAAAVSRSDGDSSDDSSERREGGGRGGRGGRGGGGRGGGGRGGGQRRDSGGF